MGGFVAAVPRGAPATPELIERVIAASADRAPDGVRHVVTPEGVLLVQCMFANTPESVGEVLPKCDPSGRVWIVKRGHLNNIDELRDRLRGRLGADARVHTDADVMLAAYLAWGPDMAGRINGEFTLAIWDGRNRSLFVLRDHLGLRGCYTHDGDEWYVAASEPAQVLPFPGVSAEMDEVAVADYISGWQEDMVRTFYEGIRRPLPATSTTVKRRSVTQRLYWVPVQSNEKATRPASYYAEEVLDAFERAVRSALRSPTTVACDLSGGLDSAAVLGMAAELRETSRATVPPIVAHSFVYPGLDCDETAYIDATLDRWPVACVRFDHLTVGDGDDDRRRLITSLDQPIGVREPGVQARDRWLLDQGVRVCLTGSGGDQLFRSAPLPIAGHSRPRGELWPYLWWCSARSARVLARRIRREIVRPKLPRWLLAGYLKLVHFESAEGGLLSPHAERLRKGAMDLRSILGPTLWASASVGFWGAGDLMAVGVDDGITLRYGYESRSPFFQLEFMELLLTVPPLAHRWNGTWRSLQKTAFRSLYAPTVCERADKAEFTGATIAIGRPFHVDGAELVGRDLVDRQALVDRTDALNCVATDSAIPFPWAALGIKDIEDWWRPKSGEHRSAENS